MTRWAYDLSRVVPYDYPTPEEEHNDTLMYVQQKFNNNTLDVIDTIDSNGAKRWNAKEIKKKTKKMRYSEIHKRLTIR
jgi:hypothetical protein